MISCLTASIISRLIDFMLASQTAGCLECHLAFMPTIWLADWNDRLISCLLASNHAGMPAVMPSVRLAVMPFSR